MTIKTPIPGKDAALEDTLEKAAPNWPARPVQCWNFLNVFP